MMRDLLAEETAEDHTDEQLLERTRAVFHEMRGDLGAVELLERKKNKKVPVSRFLNRILGVQPARQVRTRGMILTFFRGSMSPQTLAACLHCRRLWSSEATHSKRGVR